jgi:acyl-CoA thioester hydrolase
MYKCKVTPKFGDIDGLRHVNNTVIPNWFEEARNEIYGYFNPDFSFKTWNLILARFEVDFISQIFYNGNVEIHTYVSHIGNSSFEVYQEAWQNERLCSKGKTVLVHFDFKNQKSQSIPDDIRMKLQNHLLADKISSNRI